MQRQNKRLPIPAVQNEETLTLIEYHCEECPHIFSYSDVLHETEDNKNWGHPCFAHLRGNVRKRGILRCESYRICYQLVRITSPITDD